MKEVSFSFQFVLSVHLFVISVVNARMFRNYITKLYVSDRMIPKNKFVDYTIDGFPELTPASCRFSNGPPPYAGLTLISKKKK